MVWNSLIAWYLFLAGAGAGAFITAAIIGIKYPESVKMRLAGRIIAPVFLGIGLILLMLDAEAGMHNPLRFFSLVMNPASVMTLGVYFICVFMPISFTVALLDLLKKRVPNWLVWIGVVAALAVAAYTGFLLGVVKTFPLWNNAVLPILFVVSALSTGIAATGLVGMFVDRKNFEEMKLIKKGHIVLTIVELLMLGAMLIIVSTGSDAGAATVASLVVGEYAVLFWLGVVCFGLVVPLSIEAFHIVAAHKEEEATGFPMLSFVGEAGVLTGGFLLRFLVIVAALPIVFI